MKILGAITWFKWGENKPIRGTTIFGCKMRRSYFKPDHLLGCHPEAYSERENYILDPKMGVRWVSGSRRSYSFEALRAGK